MNSAPWRWITSLRATLRKLTCACACSSRPLRSTLPWFESFKGCGNTKFSQVASSLNTREATSVLVTRWGYSILVPCWLCCCFFDRSTTSWTLSLWSSLHWRCDLRGAFFLRVRIRCRLCHPRLFPDTYPTASTICSTGKKCSSQTAGVTLFDRFEPLKARKGSSDRMTGTRNEIIKR